MRDLFDTLYGNTSTRDRWDDFEPDFVPKDNPAWYKAEEAEEADTEVSLDEWLEKN